MSEGECKFLLERISLLLSHYRWLLDSFIVEFFVEDHWSKLPSSWKRSFSGLDDRNLREIGHLVLSNSTIKVKRVFPLSLLSFVASCKAFSCSSMPHTSHLENHDPTEVRDMCNDPTVALKVRGLCNDSMAKSKVDNGHPITSGLSHMFRRHVKPKKQYEIKHLGEVIFSLCQQTGCRNVIDVGSGQGHLARYLAFHYALNVTAVEAVGCHLKAAAKFDRKVHEDLCKLRKKQNFSSMSEGTLRHIETMIKPGASIVDVLAECGLELTTTKSSSSPPVPVSASTESPHATPAPVSASTGSPHTAPAPVSASTGFVLTGLHTCGDLSATMLRVFAQSEHVLGLVSVGCCYMKLTASPEGDEVKGYPMSQFLSGLSSHSLSYMARELACHSITAYKDRFQDNCELLKVHCYRAAVETLLRKNGFSRAQVKISKGVSKLPFKSYAEKLLVSVADLSSTPFFWSEEELDALECMVVSDWRAVVVFFLLRLALAPCVETMILLDRKLYLLEKGYQHAALFPLFNSKLSPRNVVLLSR